MALEFDVLATRETELIRILPRPRLISQGFENRLNAHFRRVSNMADRTGSGLLDDNQLRDSGSRCDVASV